MSNALDWLFLLSQWIETMTRVRHLPRFVITWGLMLLTVIAGGVRPSCICPDGSLCFVCPKQLDAHGRSSTVETSTAKGSCEASCGCEHSEIASRSESAVGLELAGKCNGYDCLVIAPASPVTVLPAEDPARSFGGAGVVPFLASFELPKQFVSREDLTPEFYWRPALDFSLHLTVIATTVIRC
jgi:hypothetical protein